MLLAHHHLIQIMQILVFVEGNAEACIAAPLAIRSLVLIASIIYSMLAAFGCVKSIVMSIPSVSETVVIVS